MEIADPIQKTASIDTKHEAMIVLFPEMSFIIIKNFSMMPNMTIMGKD